MEVCRKHVGGPVNELEEKFVGYLLLRRSVVDYKSYIILLCPLVSVMECSLEFVRFLLLGDLNLFCCHLCCPLCSEMCFLIPALCTRSLCKLPIKYVYTCTPNSSHYVSAGVVKKLSFLRSYVKKNREFSVLSLHLSLLSLLSVLSGDESSFEGESLWWAEMGQILFHCMDSWSQRILLPGNMISLIWLVVH